MSKKIIAIIGTYRKEKCIDSAVSEILRGVHEHGAETKKVYLIDKHIEYCTNCRLCTQAGMEHQRGKCIFNDDMDGILDEIEQADGVVLGCPVNCSTVTAVMKTFVERTLVLAYWPWGKSIPKKRIKKPVKKGVVVTASVCPPVIGKILMPNSLSVLKMTAQMMGARVIKSLYLGGVSIADTSRLSDKDLSKAYKAGKKLAESITIG